MERIKSFVKSLSVRQIILSIAVLGCLMLWGGLTIFAEVKKNGLIDQTAAVRWSPEGDAAQISCYFTESTQVDKNKIRGFEEQVNQALQQASIAAPKEDARLYMDCYSAPGTVTMVSDKASLEANAIGVGGDFFMFHPVVLLNGAYFAGDDLMHDKVMIDEDAAWQLFGSNDVVGMKVEIGGIPHYISGVVQRADGRFHEAAGLNQTLVYVSYETLEALGNTEGINTYEIVMPNPVENYAYTVVKEKFGIDEKSMWVLENSSRYEIEKLLTVLAEFGTRSMHSYAIRYPYWENVARGWEDVLALVLVLQIVCLVVPFGIVAITLIVLWKRKVWTWRTVVRFVIERKEQVAERYYKEKNKWRYF